ncbi:MAG: peptidase [Thermomicrobiales bacterium]|nr:peptidase [Thermomicrobiales bacterium]
MTTPTPDFIEAIRATAASLRDELVADLRHLISTPSVTGEEGAVQEVVEAQYRRLGLEIDRWEPRVADLADWAEHVTEVENYDGRPNLVGVWPGAGGGRSIILNGHIDTVEPGDRENWTYDPYGAEIVGDRLYGRGSCDMKAGQIANQYAVRILQSLDVRLNGDVILQSTISEEDGGAGALAAVLRGYRADAAIITEPTELAVVPAQGGSLMFRIDVPGRSAHAATRNEGVSAIEKAALVLAGLLAFEQERNHSIDHPLYRDIANKIPINVGTLRAGTWPSSVPELAVMEGRAGLVPGEDLDTFKAQFLDRVEAIAAADDWLREHPPIVTFLTGQFAAADVPVDAPILTTLASAHKALTGAPPAMTAVTYGADMRHFVQAGGVPCVMYGPGDVRVAHYSNEFVPISEVVTVAETLALALCAWCGVAG